MRNVLYGGHTRQIGSSCSMCSCGGKGCSYCQKGKKGKKSRKGIMQIQSGNGARSNISSSIGDKPPSLISPGPSSASGGYVQKCQDIKDQNICNRSQILNAENLPTTGQVTLQTCGYYPPNDTCYPVETPVNLTKIINVDPNIPEAISALSSRT